MKKVSFYRPASIDEAIQILSLHGTGSGRHTCRCAAHSAIIRTVIDTGKVLRGEVEIA